jgi:hypothetical protein
MRKLRLKFVGEHSALYLQAFNSDDARPTILEVLACLAKDFGISYEEAMRYAAYVPLPTGGPQLRPGMPRRSHTRVS